MSESQPNTAKKFELDAIAAVGTRRCVESRVPGSL